jgi:hypothetical protein
MASIQITSTNYNGQTAQPSLRRGHALDSSSSLIDIRPDYNHA